MQKGWILLLAAALLMSGCAKSDAQGAEAGILASFSAVDLEGKTRDQSVFQGKTLTMVNVWATYCGPCLQELPEIAEIHEEYQNRGFQLIGIVADVTDPASQLGEKAALLAESTGVAFTNLVAGDSLAERFLKNVTAVPTTIFVDENGAQVGKTYMGSRSKEQWMAIIDQLLEELS